MKRIGLRFENQSDVQELVVRHSHDLEINFLTMHTTPDGRASVGRCRKTSVSAVGNGNEPLLIYEYLNATFINNEHPEERKVNNCDVLKH